MTGISSLGSASSQYQTSLSSLDKNGDGIISADELAAADTTSTKPSTPASGDDGTRTFPSPRCHSLWACCGRGPMSSGGRRRRAGSRRDTAVTQHTTKTCETV